MFVIDASVTMAWCFEDEAHAAADAVLHRFQEEPAMVPGIWPLEVGNVLLVAERRGRLTEAQSNRFLQLLAQLPIEIDDSAVDLTAVVAAGRTHGLSSYDASYLVLAENTGAALATLDAGLAAAAREAGVRLLIDV